MHACSQKEKARYFVNIEGQVFPWGQPTITTEEIADLGGWDVEQGVIEIDKDNNERTLAPGGSHRAKAWSWIQQEVSLEERLMRARIVKELSLLRDTWGDVHHVEMRGDDWFRIEGFPVPAGWLLDGAVANRIDVSFFVGTPYPGVPPYGFLTPVGLMFHGAPPKNTGVPIKAPPFSGRWLQFSWQPEDWIPKSNCVGSSNLLAWSRSFSNRFREGI